MISATQQKITKIAERMAGDTGIGLSDNLSKDWLFDSLDYAELCIEIEKEFSIRINNEDVYSLQTINDFTRYVEKLI